MFESVELRPIICGALLPAKAMVSFGVHSSLGNFERLARKIAATFSLFCALFDLVLCKLTTTFKLTMCRTQCGGSSVASFRNQSPPNSLKDLNRPVALSVGNLAAEE